jgi:hypothetical protein
MLTTSSENIMRIFRVISLIAICFLGYCTPSFTSITKAAQVPECDPAPLFEKANQLKGSGDVQKDAATLAEFADEIAQTNIVCNGYRFEGKSNQVIGPIELPKGIWVLTITTKGFFQLKAKLLTGTCKEDDSSIEGSYLFSLSNGEAIEGAGAIVDSAGCRVIFTTELASEPWRLTFEPVS